MRGKYTQRRISKLRIGEISAVDSPAQVSGDDVLVKSELLAVMTLPDDTGHAHILYINDDYKETSYNSADANNSHSHPYALVNGVLELGESVGHTHKVNEEQINLALFTQAVRENMERDLVHKNNEFIPESIRKNFIKKLQEESMATQDTKEKDQLDNMQKNLDAITAELALFKSLSGLNDAEKEHYQSLDSDIKKAEFLAQPVESKNAILKNLQDSNAVIYKSISGEEFRKNDDSRLISFAKQADENQIKLQNEISKNDSLKLVKRAETELEFMPGTVETRVALLKAVDGIVDGGEKAAVLAVLAAQNDNLAKAFKTVGSNELSSDHEGSPGAQLDALAKAYAQKESVDYYTAFAIVKTANAELYKNAISA